MKMEDYLDMEELVRHEIQNLKVGDDEFLQRHREIMELIQQIEADKCRV